MAAATANAVLAAVAAELPAVATAASTAAIPDVAFDVRRASAKAPARTPAAANHAVASVAGANAARASDGPSLAIDVPKFELLAGVHASTPAANQHLAPTLDGRPPRAPFLFSAIADPLE